MAQVVGVYVIKRLLVFSFILTDLSVRSRDSADIELALLGSNGEEQVWCPSTGCSVCLYLMVKSSSSLSLQQLRPQFRVNDTSFSTLQTATGDEQANVSINDTGYTIGFAVHPSMLSSGTVYLQAQIRLYNSEGVRSNEYYIYRCEPPKPIVESAKLSRSMGYLELNILMKVPEADGCFNRTYIAYITDSTGTVLTTLYNPRISDSNDSLTFHINDMEHLNSQPQELFVSIAAVSTSVQTNSTRAQVDRDNPVSYGTGASSTPTQTPSAGNSTSEQEPGTLHFLEKLGIGIASAVVIGVIFFGCIIGGVCLSSYLKKKCMGNYKTNESDPVVVLPADTPRNITEEGGNHAYPKNRREPKLTVNRTEEPTYASDQYGASGVHVSVLNGSAAVLYFNDDGSGGDDERSGGDDDGPGGDDDGSDNNVGGHSHSQVTMDPSQSTDTAGTMQFVPHGKVDAPPDETDGPN